jgi:hypothetical protein
MERETKRGNPKIPSYLVWNFSVFVAVMVLGETIGTIGYLQKTARYPEKSANLGGAE